MSKPQEVVRGQSSVGFFGLLGLLFIALKLTGVIDWSWWLVLLPLYGGLALILIILAVIGSSVLAVFLGALIMDLFSKRK